MVRWTDDNGDLTALSKTLGGIFIIAVFIAAMALISAVWTVDAGERGVVFDQRSGVEERTYGEGWQHKAPLIEDAYTYNVKRQKLTTTTESTSDDIQLVTTTVTVHYRLNASMAWWVHQNVGPGYQDIVIQPGVEQSVKATFAKFTAEELIRNRTKLAPDIKDELSPKLDAIHVELLDVDIENIEFSEEFANSIEDKVVAEQEAQRQKNLEVAAGHEANQTVIRAQGDAKAIRVLNQQLANSPAYLTYFWIENWNGVTPKVIASSGTNGTAAELLIPVPTDETSFSASSNTNTNTTTSGPAQILGG